MNVKPEDNKKTEDLPVSVFQVNSPILRRPVILGDLTLASPRTVLTIGANGTATALTANPVGYLIINLGNGPVQVPFYTVS